MANTVIYWIHTLSPTHVGTGRGVGYIDLPIDRDKVTGWPIIRASAFKGVWADHYKATEENRKNNPELKAAFGLTGADDNSTNSGSLIPTDAQLVCLPVRSFRGTFAWVTSPLCLGMLHRTLTLAGVAGLPAAPAALGDNQAHHPEGTALVEDGHIYLEDLDFTAQQCQVAGHWADKIAQWVFASDTNWQQQFKKRFVVIPDDVFAYLCETGTEVHTRVRIQDDTKTVAEGALWTEESLPSESILAGIVQCERVFQKNGQANGEIKPEQLIDKFAKKELSLQIGGKATVGRGQVRCVFSQINGGN
ncbi:MAG: type III-B CRISPR module RAMP protein Cmr4 [Gemmatales bacterium]|nr:MAG: type III-B CRISPR module RAMP protein Cmr4 [Gemmatales bacterium]